MTHDAFRLIRPARQDTAVIFSSPHSGRDYPEAFLASSALDAKVIRSSEDAFVEHLFDMAPQHGAALLAARLPRAFLDLNRAHDELDPGLIEDVVRGAHNPRISSGLGVIPRVVAGGRAIYRGKIPLAEAEARIARYWHPYHTALRGLIRDTRAEFGEVIVIDCHSMPHEAIEAHGRPGQPRPDEELGDRFGLATSAEVRGHDEAAPQRAGFRVARNAPFAGAYITQAYGRPSVLQHVVQVEIDRSLYMDEVKIEPSPGFAAFREMMADVVAEIARIGRRQVPLAAE